MNINFDSALVTIEGKPIKEPAGEQVDVEKDYPCPKCGTPVKVVLKDQPLKDMVLKSPCLTALMSQFEDERNLSGEDKVKRYVLAQKIKDGGEVEITADESSLLQKLIGKAWGVNVVGQCFPLLNGK